MKSKILLLIVLFFSFCAPEKENPFFLIINRQNYWAHRSYRITIFDDGRVFLSTGSFFQIKGKRSFQIKKEIQKKIQDSVIEYVQTRKAQIKNEFRLCMDCIKIQIDYYNGFEQEYYITDEANKEDFTNLEAKLEEWENLLGISEKDKQCEDCK